MSQASAPARIVSLDQFRGYSVAGMFIVNYLGGLAITHQFLKHNNTHFSYADSIMPSFIFACGFSYRMSFLKYQGAAELAGARKRFFGRSLGLIFLSLMLFGFGSEFSSWSQVAGQSLLEFSTQLIKANMWEVLAIIGACQVLILPTIASGFATRLTCLLAAAVLHLGLSWSFNYDFVYGRPNWFEPYFGAIGKRAWDGGLFGLLSWSEIMLCGTLAYDLMQGIKPSVALRRLVVAGIVFMALGYGLSCLTRFYDVHAGTEPDKLALRAAHAASPVIPSWSHRPGQVGDGGWPAWLADAPFVVPPPAEQRSYNYWMMDKRVVTQSFVFFSAGFALTLFGLFVLCCDVWQIQVGVFRTFGQNPLAAYIIHHFVDDTVLALVPKDSPLSWVLLGLVTTFGITYLFVRFLEARKLFLRL